MRRRGFIVLLGAAGITWPLVVRAQGEKTRRLGVFMSFAADDPEAKARLAAFHQELERLGWSERSNLHIDYRFAAAKIDQYVPLAKELVALRPEVVLAQSTQITARLQQETRAIPSVFTNVSDPIGAGFITSLARPGGNLTGVLQYETAIMGKWLAMLKEIAPHLTRVALMGNPKTGAFAFDYFLRTAEAAAPPLVIKLVPLPVESADAVIEQAIASFATAPKRLGRAAGRDNHCPS
jgi:putative ABC transport system substrate-binding protein